MNIPYKTLLFVYVAGHSLWTGIRPSKPMKWYDRTIRIVGGILIGGIVVAMFLIKA